MPSSSSAEAVPQLLSLMQQHNLSAYLVSSSDAHASEYVADADMRRAFISGFTGSAGLALIVDPQYAKHALFTDGRYFTQALQQLSGDWELQRQGVPDAVKPEDFLMKSLPPKARVGVDPTTMSISAYKSLESACGDAIELLCVTENLIDTVWSKFNRPQYPNKPIIVHPLQYSGESHQSKIQRVRAKMTECRSSALIVSALDEVAWLLNVRGSDVEYNPVFIGYVVVTQDTVTLYVNQSQVDSGVREHLTDSVTVAPYENFFGDLKSLGSSLSPSQRVWIDTSRCNYAIYHQFQSVDKSAVYEADSPIALMKAIKNSVELNGVREAHKRDSAAMANFLSWLETEIANNTPHTEVTISDMLEQCRSQQRDFMGLSFSTIAGSGDNGAIIHYHPRPDSCAKLDPTRVLLLDSGGQYRDGTTDITRTFHFGRPTEFEKFAYTKVLQGHIALSSAVFPHGTVGPSLDVLARSSLWRAGLDYQHGTGHGVGAFLNVHEGPHGVSASVRSQTMMSTLLQPGMLVTNEPGYYHTGDSPMVVSSMCGGSNDKHRGFGIRIENLCIITEANTPQQFANKQYYTLETVSLTPISRSLIRLDMLSGEEMQWLNDYHARCRREIAPLVEGKAREWLIRETEPL